MMIMEHIVQDALLLAMVIILMRRLMFNRNFVNLLAVGERRHVYAWRIHGEHAMLVQSARYMLLVNILRDGVAAGERATRVTLVIGGVLLVLARDDHGCRMVFVMLNNVHVDLLRRVLRDVHAHGELVGVVYDRRVVVHAPCHVVDLMR